MNYYIVCYDISNNRQRSKLSKLLIQHGLVRLQLSIFIGKLPKKRRLQIENWIKAELTLDQNDKIAFIPSTHKHLKEMNIFTQTKPDYSIILLGPQHTLII